jgi:hypothetical protein
MLPALVHLAGHNKETQRKKIIWEEMNREYLQVMETDTFSHLDQRMLLLAVWFTGTSSERSFGS